MTTKKRLTEEEISNLLDTPEGIKQLAQEMVRGLKTIYGLQNPIKPPPKPKYIPPKNLIDIKGKILKIGQHVVFCLSAKDTELATGIIEKVSPQSVYIKLDKECLISLTDRRYGNTQKDRYYRENAPYFTKRLVTYPFNKNSTYNRIEIMIIP